MLNYGPPFQCDRNLPICNNCKEGGSGTECNYTPKKRNKSKEEGNWPPFTEEGSPKDLPRTPRGKSSKSGAGARKGLTLYGQNIASPPHKNPSVNFSEPETTTDPESSHTGRFSADLAKPQTSGSVFPPQRNGQTPSLSHLEFIPHTFKSH